MSDRAVVWLLRASAVVGAALAVIGSAILLAAGHAEVWLSDFGAFLALMSVSFALFVWLVIPRQPNNSVVWTMAASAFLGGIAVLGVAAAVVVAADPNLSTFVAVVPADLPPASARFLMVAEPAGTLSAMIWLTFGLLLFPDGRLPSQRWRWIAWLTAGSLLILAAADGWSYRPGNPGVADDDPLFNAALVTVMLAVIASLVALVGRFRRSTASTRDQFKWIVWGASIFVPIIILSIILGGTEYHDLAVLGALVGEAIFLGSYGIAVGKYRLFDIDVVISRTVVYGTLAVVITVVYVAAVVGVGSLPGIDAETSPWLYIGATALVAFAFEPLRARLQRLANRLVYGKRATPYEVLSDFSRKITATDDELLDQVARSLAEGTTAAEAAVWVASNGNLTRAAVWPSDGVAPVVVRSTDQGLFPADLTAAVSHDGEYLGALSLSADRGQALLPADERLLKQMAAGMGLALRNIRLSEDLRRRIEELSRSRQRLVTVQDETRRHLERQLHDGAQQRLVALKVKLTLARRQADAAAVDEASSLLDDVAAETDRAIDSLRDFARGIYPPLLEAEGPAAALHSQVHKLPIEVTVHAPGFHRHSRPVEAALYFCVLEALSNVVKHAAASSAHVLLREDDGTLMFEASDDGKGFDPAAVEWGSGLANLADRLDSLDGTLEITSSLGKGTTVRGVIPSRELEPMA